MDRVTVRPLRNDVSRIVRRAEAGERLIITSDGIAVAEIRPLERWSSERTLDESIAAGEVNAPRTRAKPKPARPVPFGGPEATDVILRRHRDGT